MANVLPFNPGERPYLYNSGASYVASGVIASTGPAILYDFSGYNSKGSAQFILFYDSATVPADASSAVMVFSVAATSNFNSPAGMFSPFGKVFNNGISWSNSSTAPAKTVGASDCFINADYLK